MSRLPGSWGFAPARSAHRTGKRTCFHEAAAEVGVFEPLLNSSFALLEVAQSDAALRAQMDVGTFRSKISSRLWVYGWQRQSAPRRIKPLCRRAIPAELVELHTRPHLGDLLGCFIHGGAHHERIDEGCAGRSPMLARHTMHEH